MQLADLLTGAVCSKVNTPTISGNKRYVRDYITAQNNGVELDFASLNLPKLSELKIHYFDPDTKPSKRT